MDVDFRIRFIVSLCLCSITAIADSALPMRTGRQYLRPVVGNEDRLLALGRSGAVADVSVDSEHHARDQLLLSGRLWKVASDHRHVEPEAQTVCDRKRG